jgi:hypothetical protein
MRADAEESNMSTPVATVADALIAFILSLLRDPAAVEEFDAAPRAMLADNDLDDACLADVQSVKPVIVDHPGVTVKPVIPPPPPNPPDEVIREIRNIVNQFTTIDARSTIVDQSTNQNIWTEGGDVTQIFDQEAVVASGDGSVAAGDDATVVDSEVDVTIGDVSVGNTTNDGSFNNTGGAAAAEGDPALAASDETDTSSTAATAGDAVEGAVDTALDASADAVEVPVADAAPVAEPVPVAESVPAPVSEPAADPLAADLTSSADTYESDEAGMVVEDAYVEDPTEEQ